jgi:CotH kinase protein/Concanavalin A-like lectin/glucanases superfamily/Secretion system C-terminal sorting domain
MCNPKFLILLSFILFSKSIYSQSTANNFTSSNLPIIIISTNGQEIVDSPRINAQMRIIDNGDGVRNYITDTQNNYNGRISIEIRGATSQSFPKKQYSFETQDSTGENNNVSLLGMPDENDWILHAPYSDKSLIRNSIQYYLSNKIGRYASRTKFCEVILNDEYIGIYVLMEKIKRDKNRVDISKLKLADNAGDSLTGGYIIKIDKDVGDKTSGWRSSFPKELQSDERIYFQYQYPSEEDITTPQTVYIQQFISDFEASLKGENYNDLNIGYHKYIDANSFADYFLLSEFSKNVDSYRLSTYLYKDRDDKIGKLTMGPIWDYNIAFGNVNYDIGPSPIGWYKDTYYGGNYAIPFWWDRLFSDSTFVKIVRNRWEELRTDIYSLQSINNTIDSLTVLLNESKKRNFDKWPILGVHVWPNSFVGNTHKDEINYLKNWISDRVAWMDNNTGFVIDSTLIEDTGEFALSFDGENDFVNCGNHESVDITGSHITLETWIKPDKWKDQSWEGVIISKDQFGNGEDHGYVLRCGNNGQVDFVLGNGNWHELYSPKNLMKLNEWNHVAASYDGSRMEIFINGKEVASKSDNFTINSTKKHLFIGSSPADNSRSFSGSIDEVRVWNTARSIEQIKSTMYVNLDMDFLSNPNNSLAGYWRFNEGGTQATKDATGNNKGSLGLVFSVEENDPVWVSSTSPIVKTKNELPLIVKEFSLSQNYPNPFNPITTIKYSIPNLTDRRVGATNGFKLNNVTLKIFDILGNEIKTLVNEAKHSGNYKIEFDASEFASGIYIYQLVSANKIISKKMILLK